MKEDSVKTELQKNIIRCADKLFLEYGCKKVTMDLIAQELHISKRTIYEQFEDKRALLEACLKAKIEKNMHHHPKMKCDDENGLLMMMVKVQTHATSRDRHERLMEDLKEYYPDIYEKYFGKIFGNLVEGLSIHLQHLQEKKKVREEVDAKVAAYVIMNLATMNRNNGVFKDVDEESAQKILSDVVFTYMRGLLTEDVIHQYEEQRDELLKKWKTTEKDIQ